MVIVRLSMFIKILATADIISSNCVVILAELGICIQHIQQIMLFMPVFFMQNQNEGVFINIHKFMYTLGGLETSNLSGVSIVGVRKHLLETIPGLKECGISESMVSTLFHVPNLHRTASSRYTGLVDCKVGVKDNFYRGCA